MRWAAALARHLGVEVSRENSALDLLRRPELDYAALMRVPELGPAVDDPKVAEQVEIETKYAGYLDRQREEIARQRRHEATAIPEAFDYAGVRGLSAEVLQKLATRAPADRRPGAAHPRRDPGGDLAAAGASGAGAARTRGLTLFRLPVMRVSRPRRDFRSPRCAMRLSWPSAISPLPAVRGAGQQVATRPPEPVSIFLLPRATGRRETGRICDAEKEPIARRILRP